MPGTYRRTLKRPTPRRRPSTFGVEALEGRALLDGAPAPTAGHRDPAFGEDGIVTTNLSPPYSSSQDEVMSLAQAPDGKIIAAGVTDTSFAVLRYKPDGTLDGSFGAGGVVIPLNAASVGYRVLAAVQDDGKVIVGGLYSLLRLNVDGTPDTTFAGLTGIENRGVTGSIQVTTLALDASGRIIGTLRGSNGFALFRLSSEGTFDATFDGDGVVNNVGAVANDLIVEGDGQIVVAGTAGSDYPRWAIARFNQDGSPDSTFGTAGLVVDDFGKAPYGGFDASIQGIAALPGGAYAVVGGAVPSSFLDPPSLDVARYSDGGVRDVSWGGQPRGMVTIPRFFGGSRSYLDSGSAIDVDAAGNIYVGGAEKVSSGWPSAVGTARILPQGVLDPTYGRGGVAMTAMPAGRLGAMVLQRDGKLLSGGRVVDRNNLSDFWLIRQETVALLPAAPVARPGGPYTAVEGAVLRLDGSTSFDVDGTIATYEWDLDYDGTTFTPDATGATATILAAAIDAPGGRTVALRVTDDEGHSSVSTSAVNFVNAPPLLRISGGHIPNEGSPYVLGLSATNVGPDTVTHWTINWGDGSTPESVPASASTATHVYADGPATYHISATATDEDGTYDAGFVGLDPAFGTGGVARQSTQERPTAAAAAQQPDGKLLLADGYGIRRITRTGGPDIAFGASGSAYGPVGRITGLVAAPDGKVLGVGYMGSVFRLNADGRPDASFGPNPGGTVNGRMGYQPEQTHTLTLQPDGKIVIAGGGTFDDFTVQRLNPDGSNDLSFGAGGLTGVKFTSFSDAFGSANAVLILPDGRILVGGNAPLARPQYPPNDMGQTRFALAQFTPDGTLDPTFGDGGKLIFNFPFPEAEGGVVNRLVRLPDGKILALGTVRLHYYSGTGQWRTRVGLARFNPDGTPDTSFGTGGAALAPFAGETLRAGGLAVAPDGKILVSSSTGLNVARFTADGRLDESFASRGSFSADVDPNWSVEFPDLFLQSDGDILLPGAGGYAVLTAEVNVLEAVSVRNVAPTLGVTGAATAGAGAPYDLRLGATDLGTDVITSWTVDWGDGTRGTYPGTSPSPRHTYARAGTYVVAVTAVDEDGTYQAQPKTVQVAPAPVLSGDGTLEVTGSAGDDTIDVRTTDGFVVVSVSGGTWRYDSSGVARVRVSPLDGNDTVALGDGAPTGAVDLGAGNDVLMVAPSAGGVAAVGGAGNDAFRFAGAIPASTTIDGGDGTDSVELLQTGPAGDDLIEIDGAGVRVNGTAVAGYSNVEAVSVSGGAGNDTFRHAGTMRLTLDGGEGNDVFDVSAADSLTASGGAGDDEYRLTRDVRVTNADGGAGNDSLTFTGGPASGSFDFVNLPDGRPSFNTGGRAVFYSALESVLVRGGTGPDTFHVGAVPAGTRLALDGGAGADTFSVSPIFSPAPVALSDFLKGELSIDAGTGPGDDSVLFSDGSRTGGTYDLSDSALSWGNGRSVPFTGAESITLVTQDGGDTVRLTPSATTAFTLNADGNKPGTFDRLELRPEGAAGAALVRTSTGGPAGWRYTFTNRRPVDFLFFEQFNDFAAPGVTNSAYEPGTGSFRIQFNDDVRASLSAEDLAVVSLATGERLTPVAINASPGSGGTVARFRFNGLAPGLYEATLPATGVTDSWGNAMATEYVARFAVTAVVGRYVFYNHSAFDGNDAAPDAADDRAIAPDKSALFPGQAATLANVTGYTRGINGIMIDVVGMPADLSAADFQFWLATGDPVVWEDMPAPSSVTVRPGAGVGGADRVTIIWPDGAIKNAWLQVTLPASTRTGLAADDVFLFGNLVGEAVAGGAPGGAAGLRVNALDVVATRNAFSSRLVGVDSRFDHNRDGRVNTLDLLVVRRALAAPVPFFLMNYPMEGATAAADRSSVAYEVLAGGPA